MIRRIDGTQLSQCLEVIHRGFMTVAEEFGLTPENCPTNGAFMPYSRLENDYNQGDLMFGCFEEGELVGFMQLSQKDAGRFELEKLSVLPEFRHRGYGEALAETAKSEAARRGGERLTIGIIEKNTRLKLWYEKLGFVSTGTREFAHLPFTVGFMELRL